MQYEPDSSYVNQEFYEWICKFSKDLRSNAERNGADISPETQTAIKRLLTRECRLLDDQNFDSWLDLYEEECAYWIPAQPVAADPRFHVTLEFHDRRRLLDRVARLGTGLAYSQRPASRTSRLWGGLEVWPSEGIDNEWRVRCNFTMTESRGGISRTLAGWYGFAIRCSAKKYKIIVKQVNLLDCDSPQGNNSFFL